MFDFGAWAERNLANLTWKQLLTAVAIAGVLAYIISTPVVQRSQETWKITDRGGDIPGVISHLFNRHDARGFVEKKDDQKDDEYFDLLIVSDSSFLVINPPPEYAYKNQKRFTLTRMIARHIETIGGKKLRIHEYYQDGTRTSDTRRALLEGISDSNIDAAIITVNPFLYFNDFMAYSNTVQRSKLLYMDGLQRSDYVQLAKTLRPSDIMMDVLSEIFPFYERRYVLSQMEKAESQNIFGNGLPFPISEKPKPQPLYMLDRWTKWLYPPELDRFIRRFPSGYFYNAAVQTNNLGPGSVGEMTMRANLRTLGKWGKPSILYFPPVNPEYLKNPNWPTLQEIVRRVMDINKQLPAKNVKLVVSSLTDARPPVLYTDYYHMKSGEGFVHQFADVLEENLGMPIVRKDVGNMFGPGS